MDKKEEKDLEKSLLSIFSRETPGYLNCYCSINAIDHRFSMGLPGCEACFVSLFTNIEYTKTKQGDHERPLPVR